MKKIYFRTDCNSQIGFGHYYRCVSVAEIVENHYEVNFVFNENKTSKNCIYSISYPTTFIKEEIEFLALLKTENIIVIDSYDFNEQFQNELNKLNIQLVVIDDLNNIYYDCNAIINHGVLFTEKDYRHTRRTKFFLGLEYLMVRKEFREITRTKVPKKLSNKLDSVFICFGGSNQDVIIRNTINILSKTAVKKVSILANDFSINDVGFYKGGRLKIDIHKNLKPNDIINLIQNSDFAILPGSTILLEAFTIGIPVISGWFIENQKYSLKKFEQLGMIINLDNFKSESYEKNLIKSINLLNKNLDLAEKQKKHIKLNSHKILKIFDDLA